MLSTGRAAYIEEPFRCLCRTCDRAEVRSDRADALDFAADHRAGYVVLTPAANLAGEDWHER